MVRSYSVDPKYSVDHSPLPHICTSPLVMCVNRLYSKYVNMFVIVKVKIQRKMAIQGHVFGVRKGDKAINNTI